MPTQIELAKKGRITPQMLAVAAAEGIAPEELMQLVASGEVVIPANIRRGLDPAFARGIGRNLRTKTNANLGTSSDSCDLGRELEKLRAAEAASADSVMDLSTAGDLRAIRKKLISSTKLVFGTVPIYEAAIQAASRTGSILDMTPDSMFEALRRHAEDGVDFVTIHAGVTRRALEHLERRKRLCGIVSRGGKFLARWMLHHKAENPFYERFDEVLEIAREFDLTLSLGDGLRPGALADAGDNLQMAELLELSGLVSRAREAGVQVMVEGPGHVPLNEVPSQIAMAKKLALGAPLYVLGPLVTDAAAGYDHIAGAIGGCVAALAGADFLCVVTPSEHISLPGPEEVKEGVIAARIAAHAADVAKGLRGSRQLDDEVSRARRARDWDRMLSLLLAPERARALRSAGPPQDPETCSMCGPYCVFKQGDESCY